MNEETQFGEAYLEKKRKVVEKWRRKSKRIHQEKSTMKCGFFTVRLSRFRLHTPVVHVRSVVICLAPLELPSFATKSQFVITLQKIHCQRFMKFKIEWAKHAENHRRLTRTLMGKCLIWIFMKLERRLHASIEYWFCANTSTFCYGL